MLLINAIKEQQTQIEDQQKRIAEVEEQKLQQQEQNRKLKERLAALKALLVGKANRTTANIEGSFREIGFRGWAKNPRYSQLEGREELFERY
jgi:TolA-binding protein